MEKQKLYFKILVGNGKFISHEGVKPEIFSPDFVSGNGWRAIAYYDGSIRCNYILRGTRGEKTGEILFKVTKDGYVNLNRRLLTGELIPLTRTYKLSQWPVDGVIGLVTGGDNGPYAYLHKCDYEKFLIEHGINKVEKENPNQLYTLYNLLYDEYTQSEKLITDGMVTKVGTNLGRTEEWKAENPENSNFELYEMLRVTSAKWVILRETSSKGERRTLITMTEPQYLTGIPKK